LLKAKRMRFKRNLFGFGKEQSSSQPLTSSEFLILYAETGDIPYQGSIVV
jgi:hypothetical protein